MEPNNSNKAQLADQIGLKEYTPASIEYVVFLIAFS